MKTLDIIIAILCGVICGALADIAVRYIIEKRKKIKTPKTASLLFVVEKKTLIISHLYSAARLDVGSTSLLVLQKNKSFSEKFTLS